MPSKKRMPFRPTRSSSSAFAAIRTRHIMAIVAICYVATGSTEYMVSRKARKPFYGAGNEKFVLESGGLQKDGSNILTELVASGESVNPSSTLDCHRRRYAFKVVKTDENGKKCWDFINVMSCWGRCDSNEIADWRFPYKKSHHPVCMHHERQVSVAVLRNCDPDVLEGTNTYEYYEAVSCKCDICRSTTASCEGLRYRGARSSNSG